MSEETGVLAFVEATRTDDQEAVNEMSIFSFAIPILGNTNAVQAVTLDADHYMEINGVELFGFTVEDGDATHTLVSHINDLFDETGVLADINPQGELVLIADDGRDISIAYHDLEGGEILEGKIGLLSGDQGLISYGGAITLRSTQAFTIRTNDFDLNLSLGGGR